MTCSCPPRVAGQPVGLLSDLAEGVGERAGAVKDVTERIGRVDLARRVVEWKTAHRELQGWMYEVIDLALGGIEALGTPFVAAIPVLKLVIGGAVVTYTVHTVASFLESDESKGATFDEVLIEAAERMLESDDPIVRQKGAETMETIARTREQRAENADDGIGLGVIVGVGAVVVGFVAWRHRKQLQAGARLRASPTSGARNRSIAPIRCRRPGGGKHSRTPIERGRRAGNISLCQAGPEEAPWAL